MPLTAKGEKIKEAMTKEYGEKKGEQVLYASKNKGTISGIDEPKKPKTDESSEMELDLTNPSHMKFFKAAVKAGIVKIQPSGETAKVPESWKEKEKKSNDARFGVDAISRATEITPGPGLDAVLNWATGNYVTLPGGEGDTPTMPEAARKATGMGDTGEE
jgi:hypothetical protein